jgi:uncharacterized phage protein (TIGR01671 family)
MMSREIKFRAFVPAECDMYYIEKGNDCWIQFDGDKITLWEEYEDWCSGSGEWVSSQSIREIEDFILMQYTNLKDKDGEEIYEGDICESDEWEVPREIGFNCLGAVCSIDQEGSEYSFMICTARSIQVIGNIYENSDLLGG